MKSLVSHGIDLSGVNIKNKLQATIELRQYMYAKFGLGLIENYPAEPNLLVRPDFVTVWLTRPSLP